MRFVKDDKVERWLRAKKIPYDFERVRYGDVDWAEGMRRQARMLGSIDPNAALTMAIDMAKPDAAFPAVVLQKPPKGRLWPWSGNHRGAAYEIAFPEAQDSL